MLTGELEPVDGFIGEAFGPPISQGGTLLTILVFMFVILINASFEDGFPGKSSRPTCGGRSAPTRPREC